MTPLLVTVPGTNFLAFVKQLQSALVARPGTHHPIETRDGLGIVIQDIRPRFKHDAQRLFKPLEIWDQNFDAAVWRAPADFANSLRENLRAPPTLSSSRFTLVTTACFKPRVATASATRAGSSQSIASGLPFGTAQNPHRRVQISPSNMNVAVL